MLADSGVGEQQIQILQQISISQASAPDIDNFKPLIEQIENLSIEWVALDKDLNGDKYALKKMLVLK